MTTEANVKAPSREIAAPAPDKCGVYVIEQVGAGRCYIGSSKRINRRWYEHRAQLTAGRHQSPFLQNAWTKHGPAAFEFRVLEECAPALLLVREQEYLDTLHPAFNVARVAGSREGVPHSDETRAKMRATHLARPPFTAEHRKNISASRRSPETSAKIRASRLGKPLPPEVREKVRLGKLGKRHPPEVVARIAAKVSLRLRGRPWSAARRAACASMPAPLSAEIQALMRAEKAAGDSLSVIAHRHGVSVTTVHRAVRRTDDGPLRVDQGGTQ